MLFLKNTTTPRNIEGNISIEEDTNEQYSDLSVIDETEHISDSITDNISLTNNFE